MALRDWLAQGRGIAYLKEISYSLKRIANALEEQNLAKGGGTGLRTFYEDKHSEEEADFQAPTDEYYRDLELLEIAKRKHGGEAADLSDDDIDGVTPE